ncbi:MAG: MarR family transcriptional regulator [Archaeoglobi archaeon]|nr:MarR family transcriptional regulator [Candidatus Mnemosynella sp.]
MEDIKKKVLEIMKSSGKPMRAGDIARELGLDSKEISKIIKDLKDEGLIHSPKRCYYAPKEGD